MVRISVYYPKQRFQWWDTDRSQIEELCYGRLSLIGVSPLWKTGYLSYCITAIETCCKKNGCHGGQACFQDIIITIPLWECIFGIGGLDI